MGPDGGRLQYVVGAAYVFTYDPQGSTVQTGESTLVGQSQYALNTLSYDGFGALTGSYSSSSGSHPATHKDPAGFGGQFGYYTDLETGL